jgi:hypothetical protein
MKDLTTQVGKHEVPVKGQHPTLGFFSGGARGRQEHGVYAFWTVVLKRPLATRERVCIARARVLLPPGERFTRMERERRTARRAAARNGYKYWWEVVLQEGAAVAYIRPATRKEANHWVMTHPADATHLLGIQVGPPRPLIQAATAATSEPPAENPRPWWARLWRRR